MSYTVKFDPTKFEPIKDHLEKISILEPGQKLILNCISEEAAAQLRWFIYDWMYHMGLKRQFKVSWEHTQLIVKRKGFAKISTLKEDAPFGERLDEILKCMIMADDKSSALALATIERDAGRLSPEEMGVLLTKYDKIMG